MEELLLPDNLQLNRKDDRAVPNVLAFLIFHVFQRM